MRIHLDKLQAALAGRYEITREIGHGATSAVYLASDLRNPREVAVKVLYPGVAEVVGRDRFLREIEIASQLVHPHILPLLDSGTGHGLIYYVMPRVEDSLRALLEREGALPVDAALRIGREVAEGLEYAHHHAVIHRDIKPENILLSEGHALIADFGIARALGQADADRLTATGVSPGTPAYMSPEQGTAEGEIGPRSDLYALGLVIYEMLAGRVPLVGPSAQATIARRLTQTPAPIHTERDTITPDVEAVVQKCLAKLPVDRFDTAGELAEALTHASERLSIGRMQRTGDPPMWPTGTERPRRKTALFAVLALATGAAAVGLLRPVLFPSGLEPDRVVVAPLQNRTLDPALATVGEAASDWITRELQRTAAVDVVVGITALASWNYVESQRARDPIAALAEETSAGIVVSGDYYSEGDSIRFEVAVTDAISGRAIGVVTPITASIASSRDQLEAIARLTDNLMSLLAVHLDKEELELAKSGVPETFESFRAYKEAMTLYLGEEYGEAIIRFGEAFARDSSFVTPLLFAALCYMNLDRWVDVDSVAQLALRFDRGLTPYEQAWFEHVRALAAGDNERAMRAINRAAQISPGSKAVYNAAHMAARIMNKPREAIRHLEQLDPEKGLMRGWIWYWQVLATSNHMLSEHGEELEIARRARELYPGDLRAFGMEAQALSALGRLDELRALIANLPMYERAEDATPGELWLTVAMDLRAHGHADVARDVFRQAIRWYEALPPQERGTRLNRTRYAEALYEAAEFGRADSVYQQLLVDFPENIRYRGSRGVIAAFLGDRDTALEVAGWLEAVDDPYLYGLHTEYRARIAAVLGDFPMAFDLIRQAFQAGQYFVGDREDYAWKHVGIHYVKMVENYVPFSLYLEPAG